MTEPASPPGAAPQPPAGTPDPEAPEPAAKGERAGTILMAVAIGAVVILVIDVAMKGKLLAPLFALLPAPKGAATTEGEPDGGLPDAAG